MKAKFLKRFLILFICLTGIWVQAQSNPCDATQGQTTRETYFSSRLGQNMFYTVYTPSCYDANTDTIYPVLYLMHGSNDDDGHWIRLGLKEVLDTKIQQGDIPPVIAILPFGNVIANRNEFEDVSFSWANIFLDELMPHAEEHYHISTEAAYRAIGGVSRGGFWAYQIAFYQPELFSAVGGHSAFFDAYHASPEYNPLDLALTVDISSLRLWLDRGGDDYAAPGLTIMNERLTQAGIEHQYTIYTTGEHNNIFWSQHIAEYVDFYTAAWSTEPVIEPTQQQASLFATNTPLAPQVTVTSENIVTDNTILYLPVVAFPSLQTSIELSQLQSIANGNYDENLVLTTTTMNTLRQQRFNLHADTRIVEDSELRDTLWQNRKWYSIAPINDIDTYYRILLMDDFPIVEQLDTYPFAVDDSRLTRITLSGVTALTRNTRFALTENGVEWAAEAIAPYVHQTDYFHTSNEVSFIENCPQSQGELLGGASSFCSKPEHFELFNLLDVDIVELTGNHNNDYGYQPYYDSLAFFRENDISTIGGGETLEEARQPLILTHNGNTIALLACNAAGPYYALVNEDENALGGARAGAAACNWDWLETAIPELSEQVDVLIVTVQYIEVEDYLPSDQQRIDFRRMANLGAGVIIGTQAHKPQTFEFYRTQRGEIAYIHYGLGNLFFDQPFWGNQRFFMDTLYIHEGQLRSTELFTGIIEDFARPRLMTANERENFLYFMMVEQNGF